MFLKKSQPQGGFSLTEQVMVMFLLAVLITLAIPSMYHFIRRHRIQSAQLDYIAALRFARSTAATRGVQTLFCPSRDGKRCNADGQWKDGWLIGLDPQSAGQPDGQPLYVGGRDMSQLNVLGSVGKKMLRFQPDGSLGASNQTLVLCLDGDSRDALLVVISRYGRIRGDHATDAQAASCAGNS